MHCVKHGNYAVVHHLPAVKGVRKGVGVTPPELDILQKLYYKGSV